MNKTIIKKSVAFVAAMTMVCGCFAGCGNNDNASNSTDDSATFAQGLTDDGKIRIEYETTTIPLSSEIGSVMNYTFKDGSFYVFSDDSYSESEQTGPKFTLYKLDETGNIVEKTSYVPTIAVDGESCYVDNAFFASDGSVRFVEMHDSYNEETAESNENAYFKHISLTGEELSSFELSADSFGFEKSDVSYFQTMLIDESGNVVVDVCCNDEHYLCIVNEKGEKVACKKIEADGTQATPYIDSVYCDVKGDLYVQLRTYSNNIDGSNSSTAVTKKFDLAKGDFSDDEVAYPFFSYAGNRFAGNEEYPLFVSKTDGLYKYKADGTEEKAVDWITAGISAQYNIKTIVDGDYIYVEYTDYTAGSNTNNIVKLRKLPEDEVVEKIAISFAGYSVNDLTRKAILAYNDSGSEYFIKFTDYSMYDDYTSGEGGQGLTKLNNELAAGNIPDLISINYDYESIENYARKDLFVDLNELIDNDAEFNREDVFDNVLRGLETNGKLYVMPTTISTTAYACKKSYFSENLSETPAEQIDAILAEHEGMSIVEDNYLTKEWYIKNYLQCGINGFIDREAKTCNFNSAEFISFINRMAQYPDEINWDNFSYDDSSSLYKDDKYLFREIYQLDPGYMKENEIVYFGEEVTIHGYPTTPGGIMIQPNGYISISNNSQYKDAAWGIIKQILKSEENVDELWYTPMNKKAFLAQQQKKIDGYTYYDENDEKQVGRVYYDGEEQIVYDIPTQEEVDQENEYLFSSTNIIPGEYTKLNNIINEELAAFNAGQITAEKAAENIQSRVQIYLNE